jgi:TetR/AcrR family transcriptional repressor of nem operon
MLVEAYLSAESRSSPGTSCPTAALAGDVAREPPGSPVGGAFAAGVEGLVGVLTGLRPHGRSAHHREDALADFSTMVGALILARATAGQSISDEFLVAARQRLVPSVRRAPRRKAPPRRART